MTVTVILYYEHLLNAFTCGCLRETILGRNKSRGK